MLRQAIGKGIAERIGWVQAEASKLPLADATFDWVVCANSFHYFRQPESALAEVRRVLRPGGSLVLVDWCDDYVTCKLCSWWLRWTDAAFFRTYALGECQAALGTGRVFRRPASPFSRRLAVGIDALYLPLWLRLWSDGLPYRLDQRRLLMGKDRADIEHQLAVAQPSHNGRRPQTETPGEFLIAERSRLDLDDP